MSIQQEVERLKEVLAKKDYDDQRASILLPDQDVSEILEMAQSYREAQAMVVIGIGGSNLGTWAIHEAINGIYHNEQADMKVYFADTTDPTELSRLKQRLESVDGRIIYVVISKSGSTAETIANASILVPDWKDAVIITGKNSKLDAHQGAPTLHIPEKVGGRYSVFSPVGLFPLAVIGVDIKALLQGARNALENIEEIAHKAQQEHEAGKSVSELFCFAPLMRLGQWRRQLIAESLGKNSKGPLPTTRIGTTDLHSTVQRSLDGPDDTYTHFLFVEQNPEVSIPENQTSMIVDDLAGKSASQLFEAVQQGVLKAYDEHERSYSVSAIETINEQTIASLMQTWMIQTMVHASLLGVNAFDQPAVESYKKHTKQILSGKSV